MNSYIFRKDTTIGNLDAETDAFLSNCFYETEAYKTLINYDSDNLGFTKRIIIGRTGSGKTALLKQIAKDKKITKHGVIEAENTVFEHIKNNVFISKLMEDGVDLRVFYKSLWLHVLLVKVINLLYPSDNSFLDFMSNLTSVKKRYNLELAKQYVAAYQDNFFNDNIVSEITDKMQHEMSGSFGFNDIKYGGKITSDTAEKIQRETASYVSKELLRKQKELIKLITNESSNEKQLRIIISIDDLDKSWLSTSKIRYDFINALLDAFKELIDIKSVKILISIRTDIIMGIYNNTLRQEEKDKSLMLTVTWNKKEIRKILDNRIDYLIKHQYSGMQHVTFKNVFSFTVNGEDADEYILNRTMLRPRDAIDFVNLCLSEGDGEVALNENLVIAAEEKFYSARKKALEKEWVSIYPQINCYLDSISFISEINFKSSTLGTEKDEVLNSVLSLTNTNIVDENHDQRALVFEELLKVWYIVGIVGIKKTTTLTIYSSFEKPFLDITDLKKEFEIHPLFYR